MYEIPICVYDLLNENDTGFLSVAGFPYRMSITLDYMPLSLSSNQSNLWLRSSIVRLWFIYLLVVYDLGLPAPHENNTESHCGDALKLSLWGAECCTWCAFLWVGILGLYSTLHSLSIEPGLVSLSAHCLCYLTLVIVPQLQDLLMPMFCLGLSFALDFQYSGIFLLWNTSVLVRRDSQLVDRLSPDKKIPVEPEGWVMVSFTGVWLRIWYWTKKKASATQKRI